MTKQIASVLYHSYIYIYKSPTGTLWVGLFSLLDPHKVSGAFPQERFYPASCANGVYSACQIQISYIYLGTMPFVPDMLIHWSALVTLYKYIHLQFTLTYDLVY